MKKLILFLFLWNSAQATKYYVSFSSGNDGNIGTASNLPWKTVGKANLQVTNIGDSILFQRGDTWTEVLRPRSNGVGIGAFGVGAAPKFTGLETLTGWTLVSGNIWKSTPSIQPKNWVNILTIGGVPQPLGRSNWIVYQSSNLNQVISSGFTGAFSSMVGAEVVVRKNNFYCEKGKVTSQSGTTIGYINTRAIDNGGIIPYTTGKTTGFSCFFQRYIGSLDQQGEWFYDTTAHEMNIYSTVNPNTLTIKTSFLDTIVALANHTGVGIRDLNIEGGNMYGVESVLGVDQIIRKCTVRYCTKNIFAVNSTNIIIDSNTVSNGMSQGIMVTNRQTVKITVKDNTVDSIGYLIGNGVFSSAYSLNGLSVEETSITTNNFVNAIHNTVTKIGYHAIHWQGSNATIRRNVVDTYCFTMDDGGGIYTYTINSTLNTNNFTNRVIDSNFVSNGIGALLGRPGTTPDVAGIYLDDQAANIKVQYNTVFSIPGPGVQMNTPTFDTMRYNTVYNCTQLVNFNKYRWDTLHANHMMYNVLYQKLNTQDNLSYSNNGLDVQGGMTITQAIQRIAKIDSNWISNSKPFGYTWFYAPTYTGGFTSFNNLASLAQWQSTYIHEQHSITPPVTLTNTNTTLANNISNVVTPLSFVGLSKIDPKGNVYNNSINMPKWSSTILIDNGTATGTNIPPVANAGSDSTITLPVNSVHLIGSATDADGTVPTHTWSLLTGTAGGTITSASSYSTTVTGLTQGTNQYQLIVTDNLGASDTDIVVITVKPAIVPPNQPPVVSYISVDKTITLPANSVGDTIRGTDADGTVTAWRWWQVFGPSTATITPTNDSVTIISNLVQGTYTIKGVVVDNSGDSAFSTMRITVLPALANSSPTALAGNDTTITLPANTATLDGSLSYDSDGSISSYVWKEGLVTVGSTEVVPLSGLTVGVHTYILTVTDNNSATGTDSKVVTVLNIPTTTPINHAVLLGWLPQPR